LAQAKLKSCIDDAQQTLLNYQLNKNEVKQYLEPIKALVNEIELWRNPSDGLVIFLSAEGLSYFKLPIAFDTMTYVGNRFYIKPLLPLYHGDGIYYVLELSQDYVKLYEATKYNFEDLFVEQFAPDQLEKSVGFDYKPKMLQFRSGQATHGGSFHGHGEGKDDTINELRKFFRAIDLGLQKVIPNKQAPLILACVNSLYPVYKEISSYPNLYDKNISGDSEYKNKKKLHEDSWGVMQEYFEKTKKEKIARVTEILHTPKIASVISDIVPAAIHGKIDTLFVQKGVELFGRYDKEKSVVTLDEKSDINNTALINLASAQAFKQGSKVYFLEPDEMPIQGRPMNALFRY